MSDEPGPAGPNLPVQARDLVPSFAAHVHVLTTEETVRITLGNRLPGADEPYFHMAFVMPVSGARAMAELILQLVGPSAPGKKGVI
jgi:hypothetical protein